MLKRKTFNMVASCAVGGVYDPETDRYDHHQRGFEHMFGHGFATTKLSSAGLVYKHYGREVIANLLGWPLDHADLETVYLQVRAAAGHCSMCQELRCDLL